MIRSKYVRLPAHIIYDRRFWIFFITNFDIFYEYLDFSILNSSISETGSAILV